MGDAKWPALAIEGIFLAANISFLLSGRNDGFILASTTILILLFTIQSVSKNPRFLYLFPVRPLPHKRYAIPALDTLILKSLIILGVVLFYVGAVRSFVGPTQLFYTISGTIIVISTAIAFPKIWDKYVDKYNTMMIGRKLAGNTPDTFIYQCPTCKGPAEYEYNVVIRESQYREITTMKCKGTCKEQGPRTVSDEPL